jgi:hypothetical protein
MPIKMFQLLAERTRSGQIVFSSDSTVLGQKGIFGFPSLFYAPSIQYEGLPSVEEHLSPILVHQEEYDSARQYGLTRFLSRLGKFCSSFPYPTWNTPARPSFLPSTTRELSILSDASHVLGDYSNAYQLDSILQLQLQLQLHQKDASKVQKALAGSKQDQVAVINTAFSPLCDASLYWQEGQEFPGAYAALEATNGMLGGSFILLGFSQLAKLSIEEDEFSVVFSGTDWDSLCQVIGNEESYETELPHGRRFMLDYVDVTAKSSAMHYEPVAIWKNLEQPAAATKTREPAPVNARVGTYDSLPGAASLAERVNQTELLTCIGRIEATLNDAMSKETDPFVLELELKITPGQVNVRLLSNIDLNPDFEDFITGTVQKIEHYPLNSQVQIKVP